MIPIEGPAATIAESITVLSRAEAEFLHHASRLETADTRNEHTASIAKLYRQAARAARVLRRFQKGRMRRQANAAEGLTANGHAEASIDA